MKGTKWASDHRLSKFDRSVVMNWKPVSYFFLVFIPLDFWCRNYWMANIWETTTSILAGNLNSGLSYLITTVAWLMSKVSICPDQFLVSKFNENLNQYILD